MTDLDQEAKKRAKLIGITGNIGSGKSEAANIIESRGYKVFSSDRRANRLMETDKKLRRSLIDVFGFDVYDENDKIDKKNVSEILFGGSKQDAAENVKKMNAIVHPFVAFDLIERVEKLESEGEKLIFNESALLFEAGTDQDYDYVIAVVCDPELAWERVKSRPNMTREKFDTIMSAQLPPSKKKKLADFAVDNDGDLEKLEKSVDFILSIIEE